MWTSFTRESGDPRVFLKLYFTEERSVKEEFCKADMNGSRKSDNNIVPEKPANKEDKTLAEQVEGRALTKGNTMNTATVRTQRRGSVSISIDGVRGKVQHKKEVRCGCSFFSMLEIPALLPEVGAV